MTAPPSRPDLAAQHPPLCLGQVDDRGDGRQAGAFGPRAEGRRNVCSMAETPWRVTAEGERQWQGVDGNWYPSQVRAVLAGTPVDPSLPRPPQPPPRRSGLQSKGGQGCLLVFLLVLVAIVIAVVVSSSKSSGADVKPQVYNVLPLDGNTVRVYVRWVNTGTGAGSASCVINTSAYNQFGDLDKIEVNSTNTNGNVAAHGVQLLYQDIGVPNGDASNVSKKDVQITNC